MSGCTSGNRSWTTVRSPCDEAPIAAGVSRQLCKPEVYKIDSSGWRSEGTQVTQNTSPRDGETASQRLVEAFSPATIDALLKEAKSAGTPIDGVDGLLNQMTKAVLERALQAEMTDTWGMTPATRRVTVRYPQWQVQEDCVDQEWTGRYRGAAGPECVV